MTIAKNTISYDIQTMYDGRWSTEAMHHDEEHAIAVANKFLTNPRCEGARVLRTFVRIAGNVVDREVFSRTQSVKGEGPIYIDRVESAPSRCEKVEDYFAIKSRVTMYRVLRTYLEKVFVIPSEVLHNTREFRRLMDKDSLVPSAVDRIAALQTLDGNDAKARKSEMFKVIDDISARNRKIDEMVLPKLTGSFAEMVKALPRAANEWERNHLAVAALTRDLLTMRTFAGKLERVCTLMMGLDDTALASLLDGIIAELLQTSVVQDILGWQASLSSAMCAMLDLADGTFTPSKSELGDIALDLNTLFAHGRLPISRDVLVDRVHHQLSSAAALYKADPTQELDSFRKVLKRLLVPARNGVHAGLHSGPATAEALTLRCTFMVERGGQSGRADAIKMVYHAMPDHAYGLVYLSDLSRTIFAKDGMAAIVEVALAATRATTIIDLVLPTLSVKERLIRATSAHAALQESAFPPDIKKQITDFIDHMVDDYMVAERLVEKLDNPANKLFDRATRLVQFCASMVLPEGKSLTNARNHVLDLLRQPNFNERFVEGIADPAAAQRAVRDFHQLLVKAGFEK